MSLFMKAFNVENPNFGVCSRLFLNILASRSHLAVIATFLQYFATDAVDTLLLSYGISYHPLLKYALNVLPFAAFAPTAWIAATTYVDGTMASLGTGTSRRFMAAWAQSTASVAVVGLSAAVSGYGIRRLARVDHVLVVELYFLAYPCRLLLSTIDPRYEIAGAGSSVEWLARIFERYIFSALRRKIWAQRVASIQSSLGSTINAPPFQYEALHSNTATRLLKMHPTQSGSNDIACELIEVEIDSAPSYTAISYVWGSRSAAYYILLQGSRSGRIAITANACAALRSVVPLEGVKYIWIDSLCIDQNNEDEKNAQISRMAQIYTAASSVLAFLEDAPGAELAVRFLHKLSFEVLQSQQNPHRSQDLYQIRRAVLTEEFSIGWEHPGWQALENMANNPYWERAWIIQEITMARTVTIVYGNRYCEWQWFAMTIGVLAGPARMARMKRIYAPSIYLHLMLMYFIGIDFHEDEKPTLGELVTAFSLARATEPVDQIYAFLSMSRDANEPILQPRRGLSTIQVYTNFVRYELSRGRLHFLEMTGLSLFREGSTLNALPSWVPDLTRPTISMPMAASMNHKPRSREKDQLFQFTISNDESTLQLVGLRIDTIRECSSDPDVKHLSRMTLDSSITAYQHIAVPLLRVAEMHRLAVASPGCARYGAHSWPEAFWRTLIQDFDGTDYPSKIDFADDVQQMVQQGEFYREYERAQPDNSWAQITIDDLRETFHDELYAPSESQLLEQARGGRIHAAIRHVTFAISEKGYWAMVPPRTQAGDVLALLRGARVPLVLRPLGGENGLFALWGTGYVHGLREDGEGESWEWLNLQ